MGLLALRQCGGPGLSYLTTTLLCSRPLSGLIAVWWVRAAADLSILLAPRVAMVAIATAWMCSLAVRGSIDCVEQLTLRSSDDGNGARSSMTTMTVGTVADISASYRDTSHSMPSGGGSGGDGVVAVLSAVSLQRAFAVPSPMSVLLQ